MKMEENMKQYYRLYCNCCGADWPDGESEEVVECPECGVEYDPDEESIIRRYSNL